MRRHGRKRAVAIYGVTLVAIALVLLVAQVVGHEAGLVFSKVSERLAS